MSADEQQASPYAVPDVIIPAVPPTNLPVGALFCWPSLLAIPPHCLSANGARVSRATYAALFGVYGTTYGAGDGSTTFNLPDFANAFRGVSGDPDSNVVIYAGG